MLGIIKAGLGAISGSLKDQFKEYFYCEALGNDILVAKGVKQTGNNKGNDNVITKGSIVVVNDGQCMIIVDNGQIVELCSEPGVFQYEDGEPSFFCGSFKEGVKNVLNTMKKRVAFGGGAAQDQRVYYINTKEIIDNKFGTATPIPFRVVDARLGVDIDMTVRCNGVYSYRISNPVTFYKSLATNVAGYFDKSQIENQLKTEFLSALQPAFGKLSEMGIRPNQLPMYSAEIERAMDEALSQKWSEARGIDVATVSIGSVTLPDDDAALLKQIQTDAVYANQNMAAGTLAQAKAQAMRDAAKNPNGAMSAIMGVNAVGNAAGDLTGMFAQTQPANGWTCSCGTVNTGKYCSNCGKPNPANDTWTCSCGTVNTGNFCSNCGSKKPQ